MRKRRSRALASPRFDHAAAPFQETGDKREAGGQKQQHIQIGHVKFLLFFSVPLLYLYPTND
ncbi:hypothetical protein GCM10020370_50760 [Paenibacillus hodogayensis]